MFETYRERKLSIVQIGTKRMRKLYIVPVGSQWKWKLSHLLFRLGPSGNGNYPICCSGWVPVETETIPSDVQVGSQRKRKLSHLLFRLGPSGNGNQFHMMLQNIAENNQFNGKDNGHLTLNSVRLKRNESGTAAYCGKLSMVIATNLSFICYQQKIVKNYLFRRTQLPYKFRTLEHTTRIVK